MQIIGLNIGGTLSRLKPLSKKLVKKIDSIYQTETRSCQNLVIGGACLFTLHSLGSGASTINHNIDCPHCNFYIRVRSFLALFLSLCNCHSVYPVFFSFLFLRKSFNTYTYPVLIPVRNHSKSIYVYSLFVLDFLVYLFSLHN